MRYHVIKGCGEIASGESVASVLKEETDGVAVIFIFQLCGGRLENVPLVMDWVKPCDLAASGVIETIHYRFHNSHFLSSPSHSHCSCYAEWSRGWVGFLSHLYSCLSFFSPNVFFFFFDSDSSLDSSKHWLFVSFISTCFISCLPGEHLC